MLPPEALTHPQIARETVTLKHCPRPRLSLPSAFDEGGWGGGGEGSGGGGASSIFLFSCAPGLGGMRPPLCRRGGGMLRATALRPLQRGAPGVLHGTVGGGGARHGTRPPGRSSLSAEAGPPIAPPSAGLRGAVPHPSAGSPVQPPSPSGSGHYFAEGPLSPREGLSPFPGPFRTPAPHTPRRRQDRRAVLLRSPAPLRTRPPHPQGPPAGQSKGKGRRQPLEAQTLGIGQEYTAARLERVAHLHLLSLGTDDAQP